VGDIFRLYKVRQLKEYRNLTQENRAKVVVGLMIVGVWLVAVTVFTYFFYVEDRFSILARLKSGLPIFNAMPLILLLLYAFFVLPMVLVGLTAIGMLSKRPLSWTLRGILLTLLVTGVPFLLLASLFGLFALIFSNLPDYLQAPLVILPSFLIGIIIAYVIKTKRVRNYLKKMYG
jgi:hypothetical protein